MTTKLEQAALQLLDEIDTSNPPTVREKTITALREALAEQALQKLLDFHQSIEHDGHWSDCSTHNEPAYPNGECDCGGYPAEQEPVGYQIRVRPHGAKWLDWKDCSKSEYEKFFSKPSAKYHDYDARKLYAAPVRTKDLTDNEIHKCMSGNFYNALDFARAVIAKFKEKNK